MMQWWQDLEPREQRILGIGAVFLAGALLYLLVWEPVVEKHRRTREQVTEQRALLEWMRERALEVERLRTASPGAGASKSPRKGSLLSLIDAGARGAGLGPAVKRVEPAGRDKARVWFEAVGFDPLTTWLGELRGRHGVLVDSMTIDRGETPGRVDARLVLTSPEPRP